jgi:hypothetical protein
MYNDNTSLTTNTSATTKNLNLSTHGELKLSSGGGVTASGVELEEKEGAMQCLEQHFKQFLLEGGEESARYRNGRRPTTIFFSIPRKIADEFLGIDEFLVKKK